MDKNTKKKVSQYIEELKNTYKNKDNLSETINKLEELGINVPENLKELVAKVSTRDYSFWSEFIFETVGFVVEIEKKVNEKEPNWIDFLKRFFNVLCKALKKKPTTSTNMVPSA
jgi:hypothetical protein